MVSRCAASRICRWALSLVCSCSCLAGDVLGRDGARDAHAGVALHVSLEFLARQADRIVVATPVQAVAQWEDEPDGSRRIVTYQLVRVSREVAGRPDTQIWVRSLGGTVGEIGQKVEGEAVLRHNQPALLFLRARADSTYEVVAMAQGVYPVVKAEDGSERLGPLHEPGMLVPRRGEVSASSALVGRLLDDAVDAIVRARQARGR